MSKPELTTRDGYSKPDLLAWFSRRGFDAKAIRSLSALPLDQLENLAGNVTTYGIVQFRAGASSNNEQLASR
jgi:hypothetical protein